MLMLPMPLLPHKYSKVQQLKDSFSIEQNNFRLMRSGHLLFLPYPVPAQTLSVTKQDPRFFKSRQRVDLTQSSCAPYSFNNSPPSRALILIIRTRSLFTKVMSLIVNSLLTQVRELLLTCQIRANQDVIERAVVPEDCQCQLYHILAVIPWKNHLTSPNHLW